MKTTIYELLGMIKDNKQPKTILFKNLQWTYDKKEKDYENMFNEWLFDEYVTVDILNEEVKILETTITYNGVQRCTEATNKIELMNMLIETDIYDYRLVINQTRRKINELIEKVNNL